MATAVDVEVRPEELVSLDPSSGAEIGRFPLDGVAEVEAAVRRARVAAAWWAELGFAGRRRRLLRAAGLIGSRLDEIVDLIHRENGKPRTDALIEVVIALDHLRWAAGNAAKVLGERRVGSGLLALNHASSVEYQPLGVIGVIGPWNYPVHTPMGSIAYALAAGNAVVFKPSEYTPGIGRWLVDTVAEAVPEQPVLQMVSGFGPTGEALCRAGVDKLAFTGSARTRRRGMAACADTLTPVLMECGGNDAMVVDADADVEAAARAAVWGAMQNAGQACIAVERAYVVDAVYEPFVERVIALAGAVHSGTGDMADFGPITMPGQVEVIRRHLDDALERGARAVVGGRESVHAPYVEPVVLVDVPPEALMLREETFGPVLPILRVRDADEAIRLANEGRYGLASAVFARRRGREIARRLRSGMTSINSVLTYAGVPSLPFGGSGESGFGRIHGADGLREFTRAKAVTRLRFGLPIDVMAFGNPPVVARALRQFMRLRHRRR